jgi:hypothetical protein
MFAIKQDYGHDTHLAQVPPLRYPLAGQHPRQAEMQTLLQGLT